MKAPKQLGLVLRLAALITAVGVMGLLIALATLESRRQAARLRVQLDLVDSQSFDIADNFRQKMHGLSRAMLDYGVGHQAAQWEAFEQASQKLDVWIDAQKRNVETSSDERKLLEDIDTAFDGYRRAARELQARVQAAGRPDTQITEFVQLETESRTLFELGWALADAHRERRIQLVNAARQTTESLRWLQLGSLGMLFLAGLALAVVVYQDLIAPLRIKLVESQALIERHEKLASLGMLAAGVAHEIRNPLTAIKAAAFLQQRKSPAGSQDLADAGLLMREVLRLERIVNDFLQFARPGKPELAPLPAHAPLEEVQRLLGPTLAAAHIRVAIEPGPPLHVQADANQLQQVLINLVQNGADAIGSDGTITLRVRAGRKRLAGREREVAILEVADTGKGIPPDVQKRLFDPFFTTKSNGTGLGLSIAARIVEEHGGALQYQTQLNVGTTFGIVLPRVTG